jgi:hypothetical protein
MKNEITVTEFGSDYKCISFTDVDPDVSGVEVFEGDNRLGSIIDLSVPDEDDQDAITKFNNEVIDFIVDCYAN